MDIRDADDDDEFDSFVGDCRLNIRALASNAAGIPYERLSFIHFACAAVAGGGGGDVAVTLTLLSSFSLSVVKSWVKHCCANNKANTINAFT